MNTLKKQRHYGVVEGFFSNPRLPWQANERLELIEHVKTNAPNINSYFYCPKDDAYITKDWDHRYQDRVLDELEQIIQVCARADIEFIYGLNPNCADWKAVTAHECTLMSLRVVEKFNQLIEVGCRRFCLLFDDIPMAYDVFEETLPETLSTEVKITGICNLVFESLHGRISSLWFCGPDYCLQRSTPLTQAIASLHPDIGLIWTGREIFAPDFTASELDKALATIGIPRDIIWWSNYPVNDAEHAAGEYNIGGFQALSPDSLERVAAVFVNPMREASANFPFLQTFSTYLSNPWEYNRKEAWQAALTTLAGNFADDLGKVLFNFSARNLVDTEDRWLTNEFLSTSSPESVCKVYQDSIKRLTGAVSGPYHSFMASLSELFDQALLYLEFCMTIISGQPVSLKAFQEWDRFPTKIYVGRYCTEIYSIIIHRLEVSRSVVCKDVTVDLVPFKQLIDEFDAEFVGSNRLIAPEPWPTKLATLNLNLMQMEQAHMLSILNDSSIAVQKRLGALGKRTSVNRFFRS